MRLAAGHILARRKLLTNSGTEQLTQNCHEQMPMDAVQSAAWFETRRRQAHLFFSARWIIGSLFRKVQTRIQKTVKSWSRIAQSHIVDAVFDLASIAIVLPFDAGVFAFGGDNLLADL